MLKNSHSFCAECFRDGRHIKPLEGVMHLFFGSGVDVQRIFAGRWLLAPRGYAPEYNGVTRRFRPSDGCRGVSAISIARFCVCD